MLDLPKKTSTWSGMEDVDEVNGSKKGSKKIRRRHLTRAILHIRITRPVVGKALKSGVIPPS